jgi:nitric oxide reductase large subunit
MKKDLSMGQIVILPFCINRKELKHPLALNLIVFVLTVCFLVAFYYMISVFSKVYSLFILIVLFYILLDIAFYLFYKCDQK